MCVCLSVCVNPFIKFLIYHFISWSFLIWLRSAVYSWPHRTSPTGRRERGVDFGHILSGRQARVSWLPVFFLWNTHWSDEDLQCRCGREGGVTHTDVKGVAEGFRWGFKRPLWSALLLDRRWSCRTKQNKHFKGEPSWDQTSSTAEHNLLCFLPELDLLIKRAGG